MADWLTQFLSDNGLAILYFGTFAILVICGLGLPIPEEATFLAAGYAASQVDGAHLGYLGLAGVLGILAGDSIPFLVGKYYGKDFLRHRYLAKLLKPTLIARAQEFFREHGSKTVFCARFVAGLRMPTFFLSASMGVRYRTFLCWDTLGALISCPTSILVAYYFGGAAEDILKESKIYALAFIAGLVIAVLAVRYGLRRQHQAPQPPKQQITAPASPNVESSSSSQAERAGMRR